MAYLRGGDAAVRSVDGIRTRSIYFSIRIKFLGAVFLSLLWTVLCIRLSGAWIDGLSQVVTYPAAAVIIYSIAIVPGFIYFFVVLSLVFDRRPGHKALTDYPGVSVLIPAYNEERSIQSTIDSLKKNLYPGELEVIVIDDGSTDRTPEILASLSGITVIRRKHAGKAAALNNGLAVTKHELVISVDSDTYLYPHALRIIVERLHSDPPNTVAVAGAILVRNSRSNFLTRLQEWDYFHGIGAIKRMQSLFQGTLVVQGAFSLYRKAALLSVGGWKPTVGEDIVLTWEFLCRGWRTGFAENAVSFTNVPEDYRSFFNQRKRWARGMIEGFKSNPKILVMPRFSTLFIVWNALFPLLDTIYLFIFVPGLIIALFGYYYIAGPMTLLVLPLTLAVNALMYSVQNNMFRSQGLRVRRNYLGLAVYLTLYQFLLVPASVAGYFTEILNLNKSWGTR